MKDNWGKKNCIITVLLKHKEEAKYKTDAGSMQYVH